MALGVDVVKLLFVASLHHPERGAVPRQFVDDPQDPLFPESQSQRFWVAALRRLGHECGVFWRAIGGGLWSRGAPLRMKGRLTMSAALNRMAVAASGANPLIRARNRALLAAAIRFRPDVVVVVGDNDIVLPATLGELRDRFGARIVYASGTSPVVFSRAIEREAAPLYDLVLVNDFYHGIQWQELGAARAEVLPLAAIDSQFHAPPANALARRNVVFVGTLVPARLYGERVRALEALASFPLDIWSVHEVPKSLTPFHRGGVIGRQMIEVLQRAAIVVNPHGTFMRAGGNLRLFEACGVGALQIADDRPWISRWFEPDRHLLTYRSPSELRDLVGTFLADGDARKRIADAGCAHAHAHHTYDRRMAHFMSLIDATPAPRRSSG